MATTAYVRALTATTRRPATSQWVRLSESAGPSIPLLGQASNEQRAAAERPGNGREDHGLAQWPLVHREHGQEAVMEMFTPAGPAAIRRT